MSLMFKNAVLPFRIFLAPIILTTLCMVSSVYGSATYDSLKPFSKAIFTVKIEDKTLVSTLVPTLVPTRVHTLMPTWSKDRRGRYAERVAQDIFYDAGFIECPAKYKARLKLEKKRSNEPEQGIDGLFLKINDHHLPLIIINESKFQWRGGPPKLSTMGCRACSGGVGETDQMSWRWIHHSLESAGEIASNYTSEFTDERIGASASHFFEKSLDKSLGKPKCKSSGKYHSEPKKYQEGYSKNGSPCLSTLASFPTYSRKGDNLHSLYCSKTIELLKEESLESLALRTATVVDRSNTIHFYALYPNVAELERVEKSLLDLRTILKKRGYKTRCFKKPIREKNVSKKIFIV